MHQLEYRRIPPLPAQTPGIPEGPRRRYLSSVVLAVFVRVTIRFAGGGGEGYTLGHRIRICRALVLSVTPVYTFDPDFQSQLPRALPSPPSLPLPPSREHPILPFRCNRTRLRMSKLTSHPPTANGNACRRGLKI